MGMWNRICKLFRSANASNEGAFNEGASDESHIKTPDTSAKDLQTALEHCCKSFADEEYDASPRSEELPCRSLADTDGFDPYQPTEKRSKFQIKLDAARNPRRRRHNQKHPPNSTFVRPTSYLESVFSDLTATPDMPLSEPRPLWDRQAAYDAASSSLDLVRCGALLAACAVADGVVTVKNKLHEKAEHEAHEARLAKRRSHYESETRKRRETAAVIRAAIPPPENPRPTPGQLLEAYRHRHDGENAALYFGRLMIDLEEHERFTVLTSGNKITGVAGGVRKWLECNCPELFAHYHTCLRFKRKVQDDPVLSEHMS